MDDADEEETLLSLRLTYQRMENLILLHFTSNRTEHNTKRSLQGQQHIPLTDLHAKLGLKLAKQHVECKEWKGNFSRRNAVEIFSLVSFKNGAI